MKRLAHRIFAVMLALVVGNPVTLVFAQVSEEEPSPDKSYALPYLLVVFLVALGLMIVLRPSLRHEEVKEKRKSL